MSRRTRRLLRRARPALWALLVGSGLLLLGAAVVGVQALQAKHDLAAARAAVAAARQDVTQGDVSRARADLDTARRHASRARGRLTDWVWSVYCHLPVAGAPTREARGLVEVTDVVTRQVLTPLVRSAPSRASWRGRADLGALQREAGPLTAADAHLDGAQRTLAGLPTSHVVVLDRARDQLAADVSALAGDVRDAAVAARVLPQLLGARRPTTLLVVAQNLAEERATGGLIGSFALVRADNGKISLLHSGTDADLQDADKPVVDLGPDFAARYGRAQATSTWRSANLTPDVPSAGAILAGLSAKQLHVPVDGVVFADPVSLSYLLRATGPVDVQGLGTLTSDNAVSLLLKDIYARYPSAGDQAARKEALRLAFDTVVRRLEQPTPGGLARELVRCVTTGHLRVYASDPSLEQQLKRSRVAGALPSTGPFLSVITQDVGGSKLDYYLHRSVSYDASPSPVAINLGAGAEDLEDATITVRLTNTAPLTGLPPYVTTRADTRRAPLGQLRSWVSVYLGPRATYSSATLDGKPVALSSDVEQGLSVFSTYVDIDPGASVTLVLKAQQPAASGQPLLWRPQPFIGPDQLWVVRSGSSRAWMSLYAW